MPPLPLPQPAIGVYPGTFDPVTRGHLDVIVRASRVVGRLVVGVAVGRDKALLFRDTERIAMLEEEIATLARAGRLGGTESIVVRPFSTLLVEFARSQKAHTIVRGLRAVSDFEYELKMAAANARLDAGIETVFLMASERLQFISSRLVREIASLGGKLDDFVTPAVAQHLADRLGQMRRAQGAGASRTGAPGAAG